MMAFLGAFLFVIILVHFTVFFALKNQRNDYADIIWGPGQFLACLGAFAFSGGHLTTAQSVALVCVFLWALRLFLYLGTRVLSHTTEDRRYLEMRQNWGEDWRLSSYLKVFLFQGFLMLVNASPVIWMMARPVEANLGPVWLGLGLWIFGFAFESLSDWQLKKFKNQPQNKGRLLTTGLWSWSRHPNYFGEITQWWGLYVMALSVPYGWLTILGPLMITFFLLKISGIPLLEKAMENRPGFAEYKARTSLIIPRPPRPPSAKL